MQVNPLHNELTLELLGSGPSLNPWVGCETSPRQQMFNSHIGQSPVMHGATLNGVTTGIEMLVGEFMTNIKMPCNGTVVQVFRKYPQTIGAGTIKENPIYYVIYETEDFRFGVLEFEKFYTNHKTFGFKWMLTEQAARLQQGDEILKDTILATSTNVRKEDQFEYRWGVMTETAFLSIPEVIEDGMVISEDLAEQLSTTATGERSGLWDSNYFPLNLYGTVDEYKPFPDIGDRIRDDGLVFAMRRFDERFSVIEMTPESLLPENIDFINDRLCYGEPGAEVYDIDIYYNNSSRQNVVPVGMSDQAEKYLQARDRGLEELNDFEIKYRRDRGDTFNLTGNLHSILKGAKLVDKTCGGRRTKQSWRVAKLDGWKIDIKYQYKIKPTYGFKISDSRGSKGVLVGIWPTKNMPIDEFGNRCHLIMDGNSVSKRQNVGQIFEQHHAATRRMFRNYLRACSAIQMGKPIPKDISLEELHQAPRPLTSDQIYDELLEFYRICAPLQYEIHMESPPNAVERATHVGYVLNGMLRAYLPPDTPGIGIQLCRNMQKHYPVKKSRLTYTNSEGKTFTTKRSTIIGAKYIMLLEKNGDSWAAVSNPKLQHHGLPAKMSKRDRYNSPIREVSTRIMGNSEHRQLTSTIGPEATANMLEHANSPEAAQEIVTSILKADKPTAVYYHGGDIINGRIRSRAMQHVKHMLLCSGIRFKKGTNNDYTNG